MTSDPTAFDWTNLVVAGLGSLGTIAALLFAVKVWSEESERVREDGARRAAEDARRLAATEQWQAERVAATIHVQPDAPPVRDPYRPAHAAYAEVHNESGMPLYDVRVLDLGEDGHTRAHVVDFVPPGGTGHVHLKGRLNARVNGQPLALSFRDAGDRWWSKCHDGHLTRHSSDPNPPPADQRRAADIPSADGSHSPHAPRLRVEAGELPSEP